MRVSFSRHARARMRQRGLRKRDVKLIIEFGSDVRNGLCRLLNRDIEHGIRQDRRLVQDLERLRNCVVIIEGGTVITCYHLYGRAGRQALVPRHRSPRPPSSRTLH